MEGSKSKCNGQLEINDLIGESVKNAVFRRNEVIDSEDAFSALSDEEANSIAGGATVAGGIRIRRPFPPEDWALA